MREKDRQSLLKCGLPGVRLQLFQLVQRIQHHGSPRAGETRLQLFHTRRIEEERGRIAQAALDKGLAQDLRILP